MHTATSQASAEFSVSRVLGKNGTLAFFIKKIQKNYTKNAKYNRNQYNFAPNINKNMSGWNSASNFERRILKSNAAERFQNKRLRWICGLLAKKHRILGFFPVFFTDSRQFKIVLVRVLLNYSKTSEIEGIFICVLV